MCGRYTLTAEEDRLQQRFLFELNRKMLLEMRYNIAPQQDAPVVVFDQGGRQLRMMRWGLVPFWAREASIGNRMINARGETVAEKPSYRKPFQRSRCLVLADGFYEWKKGEGKGRKTPMRILRKDREPFAFAGLWETWKGQAGQPLHTFTIITTEANSMMKDIHDRMPVILEAGEEPLWLGEEKVSVEQLHCLLDPYPDELLTAYQVPRVVNNPANDTPECIEEVAE